MRNWFTLHCMHVRNNSLQKQQAAIQYKIAQYITNGRVCRVGQMMRLKLKLSANSAEPAMSYEEVPKVLSLCHIVLCAMSLLLQQTMVRPAAIARFPMKRESGSSPSDNGPCWEKAFWQKSGILQSGTWKNMWRWIAGKAGEQRWWWGREWECMYRWGGQRCKL